MVRVDWHDADRAVWGDLDLMGSIECGSRPQRPRNVGLRYFGGPAAH
jgi:hypothetical protein